MGSFPTPYSLAEEIADYGLKHLDKEADISFLDPALGSGVFFSALMAQSSGYRLKRMLGYELDPDYGEIARKLWGSRLEVRIGDFLVAKPDPAGQIDIRIVPMSATIFSQWTTRINCSPRSNAKPLFLSPAMPACTVTSYCLPTNG